MYLKRGQGLPLNAIILIILGMIVLIILIVGFTAGWNTIFPFLKKNNVDQVISSCEQACVMDSKYDYCTQQRDLIIDGKTEKVICKVLALEQRFQFKGCNDKIQCETVSPEGGYGL